MLITKRIKSFMQCIFNMRGKYLNMKNKLSPTRDVSLEEAKKIYCRSQETLDRNELRELLTKMFIKPPTEEQVTEALNFNRRTAMLMTQ